MIHTYLPLGNLNPSNHSHQNLDDNASANHPNTTGATNDPRFFGFKKRVVVLFCKTFLRCLATTIFIAFVLATFKIYQNKNNFTTHQKTNFNVIITVLSLCLGLNFFDSFKDLATVLRWKLLARYKRLVRNDLILAIESLISVAWLACKSRSIPGLFIFCIIWIFMNLLAQTSVALLNLTYNLNDGTNWNGTYTRKGIVDAANLTCYVNTQNECPVLPEVSQGLAHVFGQTPSITSRGSYDRIEDVIQSGDNFGYFCRKTPGECAYRFVEYNPNDQQRTYPRFTNRVITASADRCSTYWETEDPKQNKDASGIIESVYYKISNGTAHDNITIPQQSGGGGATTYIYRGIHPPERAELMKCGHRCMWMWAHKNVGHGEKSTFYRCAITISHVSNVTSDTQIVPDGVALLAASAIALQGRWVGKPAKENSWVQFQFYPFRDHFELHGKNATAAGKNMAEFAIRSLSTMAFTNSPIPVVGLVPYLGTSLEVYWNYAIALSAGIVAVQLALSILVYVFDVDSSSGIL